MPFGMKNSASTFQHLMDDVVRGLKKTCMYIDDLIVVSPTWEAHLIAIESHFERLIEYGLTLHLNKVVFGKGIVNFLGHIIGYVYVKPIIVCSVPPTRNQRGQRRVTMINTLLKYKCDMNNRLLFVDTGLTLSDIGNDGVHLTDSGKAKLTRRVQCESLDFYRNVSSRHM